MCVNGYIDQRTIYNWASVSEPHTYDFNAAACPAEKADDSDLMNNSFPVGAGETAHHSASLTIAYIGLGGLFRKFNRLGSEQHCNSGITGVRTIAHAHCVAGLPRRKHAESS